MSAAVPAPYQYQAQQNQFSPPHSLSQPPPPPQYITSQSTHYSTTLQYIQSLGPPSQRPPQNGPPQFMYPPSQYLSPTVQCPCCSTRFTHFVIQYDPALTTWSFGAPSPAAPPMMPPAAMPPQYAPAPAQQRASMPTQNIDFDQYLNKVLSVYNKYSSSSRSKEYDNAFDARSEIEGIIQTIREQASKVSFAGKQDAICAIINIGLEVLDEGGSTLDSEIRKGLDWSTVGGSIEGILELLSHDEIAILREDGDMAENLHRLKDDAEQYALDPSLDEPILMVTTTASEQEDEDDEDDEDGSEDEDH